ncbi:MAG: hypothetical protein H7067_00675 [Burkholderiales bacterium]|nr:hypothetical protein [Opitutaceae bacterium]
MRTTSTVRKIDRIVATLERLPPRDRPTPCASVGFLVARYFARLRAIGKGGRHAHS